MRGYWGGPPTGPGADGLVYDAGSHRRGAGRDGWLTTGDFGSVDDDGRLHLVGRANELYIRGGYNVYPAEVEAVLGGHPAVDQVAVVGAPDPVLGEIGVAFVVPAGRRRRRRRRAAGRAARDGPGHAGRLQGTRPAGGGRRPPPDLDDEGRQAGLADRAAPPPTAGPAAARGTARPTASP